MKNNQQKVIPPNSWQKVRLADIGSFSKGAGISKEQLSISGYNAVRYGELYTKFDFQIKKIYSHIPESIISQTKKIKYGDILFAGSGETIDEIGKSAAYLLEEKCYAGGDIIIFTPKSADSLFLSYFLNVGEARKKLRELGQGQSVVHIYKSDLENVSLHLPTLPEQKRIVAVLETWDQAIEKLVRKIKVKKNVRKGLEDSLVFRRNDISKLMIDDIFDLGRGRVISKDEIERNGGAYPVYSSQTLNNGVFGRINTFDFEGEYLTWTTDGANAGKVFYRNGKFNCTNVCGTAKIKEGKNADLYFIGKYLNYVTKRYVSYVGNPKLMNGVFGSIEIRLPSFQEQKKVAEILMIADKEIEALEKKLSVIKEQKKFLLNNLITGVLRTPEKESYV